MAFETKINITLTLPKLTAPQAGEGGSAPKVSIKERVLYAIDCFQSGHETKEAFSFLRKVYEKIAESEKPSKENQELLDLMYPIMQEFGALEGVRMRGSLLQSDGKVEMEPYEHDYE
jgi:hypothetical protein